MFKCLSHDWILSMVENFLQDIHKTLQGWQHQKVAKHKIIMDWTHVFIDLMCICHKYFHQRLQRSIFHSRASKKKFIYSVATFFSILKMFSIVQYLEIWDSVFSVNTERSVFWNFVQYCSVFGNLHDSVFFSIS